MSRALIDAWYKLNCLLFHRRKKKTATPTSIRNTIPPITPPAIAPVFDLGSKTANLKHYRNFHPLKKSNTSNYFHCLIKLTTKMFLKNYFSLLCIINSSWVTKVTMYNLYVLCLLPLHAKWLFTCSFLLALLDSIN